MNYLRILNIPILLGLFVIVLAGCPKEPDQTNVSIDDDSGTPSTTIVETEETPPAETNIDIDVDASTDEPVVVTEEVRTAHPEVVTVLEQQVSAPTDTATVYVADAPAIQVWTTEVVPATPPADVFYRVRDFNVTNATDTELVADGYVLVGSPSPDFTSERKYVTYTFRRDEPTATWKIWDIDVTRTEAATPEDLGTTGTATEDTGAAGDTGDAGDAGDGAHGEAGGDTGGGM